MVGTFLFLIPMVPYAAFRATAPEPRAVLPALTQTVPPAPLHPPASPEPSARSDGSAAGPFSPGVIRARSRGWEWKNLETPGWKLLMAPHFVVRGDVPIGSLRSVAVHLEEFLQTLHPLLGGDISDLKFSTRVFADARDFRRYAIRSGAPNAESFYDPRSAEVVLCLDGSPTAAWLQKTLAHEFTHEYMDRVWKRTGPLWFAEGMAEYFSNFILRDGRVVPGAVDPRAVLLLSLEEPTPLSDFLKIGRDEMYGVLFARNYAQAWSFVHYLFTKRDDLIDLLLRGGTLENLEPLEKEYLEHVKSLN